MGNKGNDYYFTIPNNKEKNMKEIMFTNLQIRPQDKNQLSIPTLDSPVSTERAEKRKISSLFPDSNKDNGSDIKLPIAIRYFSRRPQRHYFVKSDINNNNN